MRAAGRGGGEAPQAGGGTNAAAAAGEAKAGGLQVESAFAVQFVFTLVERATDEIGQAPSVGLSVLELLHQAQAAMEATIAAKVLEEELELQSEART